MTHLKLVYSFSKGTPLLSAMQDFIIKEMTLHKDHSFIVGSIYTNDWGKNSYSLDTEAGILQSKKEWPFYRLKKEMGKILAIDVYVDTNDLNCIFSEKRGLPPLLQFS